MLELEVNMHRGDMYNKWHKLALHILHSVPLVIDIREVQYKKKDLYYRNMNLW